MYVGIFFIILGIIGFLFAFALAFDDDPVSMISGPPGGAGAVGVALEGFSFAFNIY